MKNPRIQIHHGLALAALLLGSATLALAQTDNTTVSSFDSGTPGLTPAECGIWYGSSMLAWDNTEDATGNGGGSLYISATFSGSSDTPMTDWIVFPGDNLWWNGNTNIPISLYKSIQFDIKWDNSSSLTIDDFNTLSPWPADHLQGWAPSTYLDGSIPGLEICVAGLGSPGTILTNIPVPAAAATGWAHVTVLIDPTKPNIDGGAGIYFHKWINQQWGIAGSWTANMWIDNVFFEGFAVPPPPPTVHTMSKPYPGLNAFMCSAGLYDRQSAMLVQSNNLSWVGVATPANPVTYSFTVSGYPKDPATQFALESYLFLCPNPAYNDNAPDWNETNVVVASIQTTTNGARMSFQYKVGEPSAATMYYGNAPYTNAPGSWDGVTSPWYESGNLGTLNSTTAIGTWTVKFTSDTNVTLIAPDLSTTNLIIPPYNAAKFAEVNPKAFSLYLGGQANNAASQNNAIGYSSFEVTGTAAPVTDNFLTDSVLNTNIWNNGVATTPSGVFVMTNTAAAWISWTTPASGFKLQNATDLTGSWTMQTNNLVLSGSGAVSQLLTTNDFPVGTTTTFYRLIK